MLRLQADEEYVLPLHTWEKFRGYAIYRCCKSTAQCNPNLDLASILLENKISIKSRFFFLNFRLSIHICDAPEDTGYTVSQFRAPISTLEKSSWLSYSYAG